MKLFRQSIIILGVYIIGELISKGFNLPIPGNILGMLLLFTLLCTNVINVEKVEMVGNFFLDHLAFFFIPAGVALLNSFDMIKSSFIQIVIICLITTVIVIAVTGKVVQFISNKLNKKAKEES
ncbi:CidA/LrgA family protein [Clostridium sp.]|uniref:CidA/LrgA family protein n=1 Tax=Clostridium sp. TaxID=1506 RepID=UPI003F3D8953